MGPLTHAAPPHRSPHPTPAGTQGGLLVLDSLPTWLQYLLAVALVILSYVVTGRWLARALLSIVGGTQTTYDDIVVQRIKPRRLALLAPVLTIYLLAYLIPNAEIEEVVRRSMLIIGLWLLILTASGLLDAINDIYESRREFSGVAIKGYFDLLTILFVGLGAILTIAIITGQSPFILLTGLGALMAVLLLVFRDTILSLVASVQISTNDLVKQGDWLEVPAYNADGDVIDISLHQIKVQNWDKTISYVPTYRLTEVAFKNWRGMSESGGRRIKRSIYIDENTIRFCDEAAVARLRTIEPIREFVDQMTAGADSPDGQADPARSYLPRGHRLTNIGAYRAYIAHYLRQHPGIRGDMPLLVRELEPSPQGLPIEIYAFTNTTVWEAYEDIQAEIFDHLMAVIADFDLRIYQQPSGTDFAAFLSAGEVV
jgi:miniconductance mechanosensitive channel